MSATPKKCRQDLVMLPLAIIILRGLNSMGAIQRAVAVAVVAPEMLGGGGPGNPGSCWWLVA